MNGTSDFKKTKNERKLNKKIDGLSQIVFQFNNFTKKKNQSEILKKWKEQQHKNKR